ncbi:hypothetical protein HPB48_011943 [Haemaphysalis longicornis]|uniref:Uncharacterized protein n=1 Tax=Haemaphysalis longicornis TaxID=44386 RepID=A0A9J6GSP0_HAELO|nr:hypothetical protein HPB48_011943 [Haemaphysalis longicornis]
MADRPLDGAAGHATHLSLGPSKDEAMEMRDVHDDPPPEEKDENAHIPWIEVTSRSQRRKMQQLPTTTPLKPALRQSHVARKPKTLPLPADDYKLAIRPRNGLQLSKVSPMDLTKAIAREANLRCGIAEIKIRIDEEQNVLIVSTPSPATAAALNSIKKLTIGNNTFEVSSYGVSPDNSCKGVIYNIGLNYTPKEVQEAIVAPNHELLTCRRMGNTGTFLLTFKGKKVPYSIYVAGVITRCYLYKRTVAYCDTCHQVGHRADVCPNPPKTPKCKTCGSPLTSNQHDCHPKCLLCSGAHTTASKACPQRFLPPVNRRKQVGNSQPPRSSHSRSPSPRPRRNQDRSRSRSQTRGGGSRGPDRGSSGCRLRSESKSRDSSRGRSPSATRGNREGSQNSQTSLHRVSWAKIVDPKAHNSLTPTEKRLLEENAMLRDEIAALRADMAAMKEEINNYRKASSSVNTQMPSPEQRNRAVTIPPQPGEEPLQPNNLLQPDNNSNIIFPQCAMEEQAQVNVARAITPCKQPKVRKAFRLWKH